MTTLSPLNKALRDLVAHVVAFPSVADITDRVTIDAPTTGSSLPYITVKPTQEGRIETHSTATTNGERSLSVQLECDALTAHEARELAHAVESAVDQCPQFAGDTKFLSTTFEAAFPQSFTDAEGLPQGTEETHRVSISFSIQYQLT